MYQKVLFAMLTLALVACGDSDSSDSNATGGMNAAQAGGTAASPMGGSANAAPVVGSFIIQNGQTNGPIEGAEICIDGKAACLKTDADGKATIEYRIGDAISASIKADGYRSARASGKTRAPGMGEPQIAVPLISEAIVDILAQGAELEPDPAKGHIAFAATISGMMTNSGKKDVGISISPAGDGPGPLYTREGDLVEVILSMPYDAMLTGTSSSGLANYFNVTQVNIPPL